MLSIVIVCATNQNTMKDQTRAIPKTVQFNSKLSWSVLLVLLVAIFAIYVWHLDMPYFGDDFQQVYYNPLHSATAYLFSRPPFAERYIPIQTMVLSISQVIDGLDTSLVRVFNIIMHSLVCWLTWHLALRLGISQRGAAIAAGFVAVSQLAGTAVLMNDSPSQIISTAAGLIALIAAFEYARSDDRRYLLVILGGIILGFLSKETFVGWAIPIVAVIGLRYDGSRWHMRSFRSIVSLVVPVVLLFAGYILFHASLGLPSGKFGAERYDLRLGSNILINVAQMFFAAFLPESTVWVYLAIAHKAIAIEIAASVSVAIVAAIAIAGFVRLRKVWMVCVFGAIGSMSPVIFLNHVGELYAYSLLPFVALGFAAGCEILMLTRRASLAVAALVVVGACLNIWSVFSKQSMMLAEGKLEATLLPKLQAIVARLPTHSRLYLVNPVQNGDDYSVFLARGFHLFEAGEIAVSVPIGRNDVVTEIIEEHELDSILHVRPGVPVTYDPKTLTVSVINRQDIKDAAMGP